MSENEELNPCDCLVVHEHFLARAKHTLVEITEEKFIRLQSEITTWQRQHDHIYGVCSTLSEKLERAEEELKDRVEEAESLLEKEYRRSYEQEMIIAKYREMHAKLLEDKGK